MANEFIIKNGFHSKGDSEITGSVKVNGGGSKEASLGNNILNENITNYKLNTVEGLEQYAGSFPFPSPGQGVKIITNPGGRDVIHTTSTTTTKYEVNQAYFQVYYNNTSNSSTMKIDSDYNLNTSTFNVSSSNFHITPSSSLTTITDPSALYYTSSFSILNNSISGSIISGSSTTTLSRTHNSSKDLVTNGTSTSFNNIENNITQLKSSTPSTNEESYLNISPGEIDLKFNNTSNSKNSRLSLLESGVSLGKFNATGNNGNGSLFIGNNNLNLTYSSGSNSAAVILDPDYLFLTGGGGSTFNISSSITFTDNRTTKKGIEYDADYSANFTNRSLIDKEYVVDYVAASGSADTIYTADGTLTGDRTVDLDGNKLTFNIGATGTDDRFLIDGSNVTANDTDIFTIQGISNKLTVNEDGYIKNENVQNNEALYLSNSVGSYGIASRSVNNMFVNTNQYFVDTFGSTNYIQVYSQDPANGIRWVKQGNVQQHWIRSGNLDRAWFFMDGLSGTSSFIVGASTKIGTEDISLQGDTLVSKKLELSTTTDGFLMPRLTTAQKNAISSPNTNLMVFDTDLSSLQRYNGSAWVAMAAGYGVIEVIKDSDNGNPTFYSDLQSALDTCKTAGSNNIIKLHSDISLSAQININTGGGGAGNGYQFKGLLIDGNGFEITFDDTGTDNAFGINLTLVQEIILNNLRILRINGTGTHYALDIDGNGNQKLSMSNSYIYSDNGGAAFIQDITGNMFSLGGSKFESDGSINTLTFRSYNMFFKDFITISNGTGDAILNYSDGEITKFYCENTSTGRAYDSQANSVATFFSAKSNSGDAVYANVASCRVSNFYATSTSGNAFHGNNATNFHLKTGNNVALQAGVYANLKNGYVENNSTSAAMDTNTIEYCHNVTFVNLGSGYGADITNTIGYNNKITNCTFISKGGIGAFLDTIATNLYNCVFISKYNNAAGHACEVDMGGNILMGCSFIVENNSANCIYSNSAVSAKVGNCNFDNATTPINANITLDSLEIDAFGNVTT